MYSSILQINLLQEGTKKIGDQYFLSQFHQKVQKGEFIFLNLYR